MAHLQIRNVPPDVHRKLKARAAKAGMSLSEYLRAEITLLSQTPTIDEWVERVRRRPMIGMNKSSAEIIREEREARDRQLDSR